MKSNVVPLRRVELHECRFQHPVHRINRLLVSVLTVTSCVYALAWLAEHAAGLAVTGVVALVIVAGRLWTLRGERR